ncbi:hypothetical protein G9A89_004654 [Geosiphon pyriformis]|nr:hypothetical protein G9A89_004654 [Geosiphon pyriformis]
MAYDASRKSGYHQISEPIKDLLFPSLAIIHDQTTTVGPLALDCLDEIFQNLLDDKATLFSCALVNRAWCRLVIPTLWSSPINPGHLRLAIPVISILLASLPEEEKLTLIGVGFPFPATLTQPVFKYAEFIKELHSDGVELAVRAWILKEFQSSMRMPVLSKNSFMAINAIMRLILRESRSFERLIYWKTRKYSVIPDFSEFENVENAFSQLKQFEFGGKYIYYEHSDLENVSKALDIVNRVSRNLKCLRVDFHNCNELRTQLILEIIALQKGLERVELLHYPDSDTEIFSILRLHMKSLRWLQLKYVEYWFSTTQLEHLEEFTNLETLVIYECTTSIDTEEALPRFEAMAQGPMKLKQIYFECWNLNGNVLIPFVSQSSIHLKELIITNECPRQLLDTLAICCPNITLLAVNIDESSNPAFLNLLGCLSHLKCLSIRCPRSPHIQADDFWISLAYELPQSVRYIYIDIGTISNDALSQFFEKREWPISRIGFGNAENFDDNHIKTILKFAREKGSVQEVGFSSVIAELLRITDQFTEALLVELKTVVEIVENIEFDQSPSYLDNFII